MMVRYELIAIERGDRESHDILSVRRVYEPGRVARWLGARSSQCEGRYVGHHTFWRSLPDYGGCAPWMEPVLRDLWEAARCRERWRKLADSIARIPVAPA